MEESRLPSILENAHPPGVLLTGGHVIRHDIEKKAEVQLLQLFVKACEVIFAAELRIERGGVDDVVSVRAPLPRFQDRRRVEIADPELAEVVGNSSRVFECEAGVELDAVGGDGDAQHSSLECTTFAALECGSLLPP